MKVRALKSFSGAVNMSRGQEMDIQEGYILHDLLKAGYVEALVDTLAEAAESANAQTAAETETEKPKKKKGSDGK